ncbi:MAG: response regulator transcription factor [Bdellovibrionaceae bacterium]|nr:response regulator transcription factor [Pseudobdellovibrionaceae bacterium]
MGRVLCVEDGLDTIAILEATLRGHDLRFARSLREAEEALTSGEFFHLILLDIELPDGSGIDLMSRHASEFEDVSVILLTGKTDLSWKAAAFALGAEDFIEKPFDPQELRLRVEAKLRREQRRRTLHLGNLTCSLDEQRLFKGPQREPVDLTTLEFRIFTLLARTPQKIFARGEILDRVWGSHVAVTERAVDVHVSNLRKKLEDTGVTIEAVVGAGYRLSAPNLTRGRDLSL